MAIRRNKLTELSHFSRVRLCGPQAYPLHDHDFGEIFWVDDGTCRHHINGRDLQLKPGTLVFIRPRDAHSFHGPENQPFYINNTCFDWRTFCYLRQRYFPGHDFYGEAGRYPKMLHLPERQLQKARRFFLALFHEENRRLGIERFLLNMLSEFCPPLSEPDQISPALPDWMEVAWRQIHEPEHFRRGVAEFSRLCGRSREHVSREFRRAAGFTLNQHIRKLRMKHAALLLEASSSDILDIAMDCGFESLSHFYTCFRSEYQISPAAYRQRAQGKMYAE